MKRTQGRAWCYALLALGGTASIAANIAHSFVPPEVSDEAIRRALAVCSASGACVPTAASWSPPLGAIISAMFWPTAVFVAIEAFARVKWPARWWWSMLRFGGLLPVALVAAIVSYQHLSGLLASFGTEGETTATAGPLVIDGIMLIGTAGLIATGWRRDAEAENAGANLEPAPAPAGLDHAALWSEWADREGLAALQAERDRLREENGGLLARLTQTVASKAERLRESKGANVPRRPASKGTAALADGGSSKGSRGVSSPYSDEPSKGANEPEVAPTRDQSSKGAPALADAVAFAREHQTSKGRRPGVGSYREQFGIGTATAQKLRDDVNDVLDRDGEPTALRVVGGAS